MTCVQSVTRGVGGLRRRDPSTAGAVAFQALSGYSATLHTFRFGPSWEPPKSNLHYNVPQWLVMSMVYPSIYSHYQYV